MFIYLFHGNIGWMNIKMYENIGLEIIIILTVIFIFFYMLGRRYNIKREREIWSILSEMIKETFNIKKIEYRGFGSSGYQILIPRSRGNISRYEVTVLMMDRENILHYLLQRIRRKNDLIIIKADFKEYIGFHIDIYNTRMIRHRGGREFGSYSGYRYEADEKGKSYLNKVFQRIGNLTDILISVSISPSSPNLILTVLFDKEKIGDVIRFSIETSKIVF